MTEEHTCKALPKEIDLAMGMFTELCKARGYTAVTVVAGDNVGKPQYTVMACQNTGQNSFLKLNESNYDVANIMLKVLDIASNLKGGVDSGSVEENEKEEDADFRIKQRIAKELEHILRELSK